MLGRSPSDENAGALAYPGPSPLLKASPPAPKAAKGSEEEEEFPFTLVGGLWESPNAPQPPPRPGGGWLFDRVSVGELPELKLPTSGSPGLWFVFVEAEGWKAELSPQSDDGSEPEPPKLFSSDCSDGAMSPGGPPPSPGGRLPLPPRCIGGVGPDPVAVGSYGPSRLFAPVEPPKSPGESRLLVQSGPSRPEPNGVESSPEPASDARVASTFSQSEAWLSKPLKASLPMAVPVLSPSFGTGWSVDDPAVEYPGGPACMFRKRSAPLPPPT